MKCLGKTKAGKPCGFHADESGYCRHHKDQASEQDQIIKPEVNEKAYVLAAKTRKKNRDYREKMGALPGQKLIAGQKTGFVRRWVNDENNNIDEKKAKGYSFVTEGDEPTTDAGAAKSQLAGTQKSGQPLRAYLMEIPEEFYNEDQQEKESRIIDQEDAVREAAHGGDQGLGGTGSIMYNPSPGSNHLLE